MIIGGFQPLSLCDFPHVPAAVIFTQGCNWRCNYCHNKRLLPMHPQEALLHWQEIAEKLKTRKMMTPGVVFSGGEPTLQADLSECISELKEAGLKVKLDSNGSHPAVLRDLLEKRLLDFIAMDIKAPLAKYQMITECPVCAESVMQSIHLIAESGVSHQFRTTWPPHLLTSEDIEEIREMLPEKSEFITQQYRPQ